MELPPEETQAVTNTDTQAVTDVPQKPDKPKTPMPRRKKLIIIISACAVFVAAAAITLTLILVEAANSAAYKQAVALMDTNDLQGAKEDFLKISGYKDSAAKATECQNKLDFDSADALLRSEDYAAARNIFAALGSYSGAPDKVNECDYNIAAGLLKGGEPEKAKSAFLALGDYSDSAKQAALCQNEIDYMAALKLIDEEDYEGALKAFIALKGYNDSNSRIGVCQRNIDYAKANKLLADGKFYDAYSGFKNLGAFKDSAERMAECIQTNPLPGEIYRNPDFAKKASTFMVKTSKDEYIRCIRIYSDTTLVSTIFLSGGKTISIKLPAGTYSVRYACGKNWFGPDGLFGDESDSFYCILIDSKGNTTTKFTRGRGWWWDLRNTVSISPAYVTVLNYKTF